MAGIEITFGQTNSPLVSDAVSIARKLPGFQQRADGKRSFYSVAVPLADAIASQTTCNELLSLVGITSRWQSTRLTLDGEQFGRRELDSQLRSICECFQSRAESQLGDEYCSGKQHPAAEATCFGCRKLGGVSRSSHAYASDARWFHYGEVSPDASRFDVAKSTIIAKLEERAARSLCRHCPAFDLARVGADVETLPDFIDLGGESRFEIQRSTVNPQRVLGIQPRPDPLPKLTIDFDAVLRSVGVKVDPENESASTRTIPTVRYTDVAGMDRAVAEIRDIVELPIKQPTYFTSLGLRPHRGVILYGPPGNGKTLLVKAVATESDAHLEIINGPEVLSKWVGESERKLRDIFDRAKQLQPSIVLIDEIDAISSDRDGMRQHHDVVLISQLLALLDGIEELGNVFVVGTTNRLEAIDPAIRRPGRFDYHICVPLPDAAGRRAILSVHLTRLKFQGESALSWLAESTDGWSGAELAAVCREAGLVAIKRSVRAGLPADAVQITEADLRLAFTDFGTKRADLGSRAPLSAPEAR
jgi:ATP-dependent 26S proteasome regulatory subunit